MKKILFLNFFLFILTACAKPPKFSSEFSGEENKYSQIVPGWLKPYYINGKTYFPLPDASGYEEVCLASWYGPGFHGNKSSDGGFYNMYEFTAAHKLLPLGTYVLVTNLENGKQVVVRISDRGPFIENRCIDLSYSAAKELEIIEKGIAKVKITALSEGEIIDGNIVYKNIPDIRFREFYLQIGSFRYYENAKKLKNQLEKEFNKIDIEPFRKNGITFYRVQVYLSNDLYEAFEIAKKLKKDRFSSAFLVAK